MNSREKILSAVKEAQPHYIPLSDRVSSSGNTANVDLFQQVLKTIGADVWFLNQGEEVAGCIKRIFPEAKKIVSAMPSLPWYLGNDPDPSPHSFEDVEVCIIKARLGVTENGAVWVTEDDIRIRVLPFICTHLVAVVEAKAVVATMHDAYEMIDRADYGFGTFIAGPSKTADIEQSLVLGAHGPKTMTVLLLG